MKDLFGNELSIGDTVAVTPKNYRGLIKAKIVKFTEQNVKVVYKRPYHGDEEYLVPPNALVKRIIVHYVAGSPQ